MNNNPDNKLNETGSQSHPNEVVSDNVETIQSEDNNANVNINVEPETETDDSEPEEPESETEEPESETDDSEPEEPESETEEPEDEDEPEEPEDEDEPEEPETDKAEECLHKINEYNSDTIDNFMQELESLEKEQQQINDAYKTEGIPDKLESLETFMNTHAAKITTQKNNIGKIISSLKSLVKDNQREKDTKTQYNDKVNSKECNDMIVNLNSIQSLKNDVKSFLESNGFLTQIV